MSLLTGLKGAYRFYDEEDSHLYRYHLTENGTPTYAAGKVGNSVAFDGATDYLSLTCNHDHDFQIGDVDWACSFWFKFESGDVGSTVNMVGVANADWFISKQSNERIRFQVNKAGGGAANCENTTTYSDSTWIHVFAWFDASAQEIGIRINDTDEQTTSLSDDVQARDTTFRVGGYSGSVLMEGEVDALRIYKGYIPSSSEITTDYNSGSGTDYFAIEAQETNYNLSDKYERRGDRFDVLTEVGSPTYTTGKVGDALELSGTGQYVTSSDHVYKYIGDEDFCGSVWIYPHALANDGIMGQDNNSYSLQLRSTGAIRLRLNTSGGAKTLDTTGTVAADTWSHISWYHDSSGNEIGVRINNGTAETLTTSGDTPDPRGTTFSLGSVGTGNLFDGLLDGAKFRRGGLFSGTELSDDYNSGSGAAQKTELELDYVDNSDARRVKVQAKSAEIGGTGTQTCLPLVITQDQLRSELWDTDNTSTVEGWGGYSVRLSTDEDGTNMVPLHTIRFVPDATAANIDIWLSNRSTLDGTSGTDFYLWWIKSGSSKARPRKESYIGQYRVYNDGFKHWHHLEDNPDGGTYDATSNGEDTTDIGTMVAADSVAGKIGNAADFDGTDDGLQIAATPAFPDPSSDFAVGAWVKPADKSGSGFPSIAGQRHNHSGSLQGMFFDYNDSTDKFRFVVRDDGTDAGKVSSSAVSTTSVSFGSWQHVIGRFDASAFEAEIFYNGTSEDTDIGSGNSGTRFTIGPAPYTIGHGRFGTTSVDFLQGAIDEKWLYEGTLTADQITTLFNNQDDPESFWDHTASVTTPTSSSGTVTAASIYRKHMWY